MKYLHDTGYLHLDIKPQNFLVNKSGNIKLGDFNLSKKKNNLQEDFFEGDSVYLAPEMMELNNSIKLNEKCDVFSLGLSILEILSKIELPENGLLWHRIRSRDFVLTREYFENGNIKDIPASMISLLHDMINSDSNSRKDLKYLIENYIELKTRFERLNTNKYTKSYANFLRKIEFKENEAADEGCIKKTNSSLSYKQSFN